MKDVEIFDGNPVWKAGITPFAFYDNDEQFQKDAVRVAKFCGYRLGYPLMDIELQSGSMFACFEEAVTRYGNSVYAWKVKENYLSLEGGSKDMDANNMVVEPTLQRIVEIAKNYGTEADVGGNIEKHVGLLDVEAGKQTYDLNKWAKDQGIEGGIEIRKIFYEAPPAILRYFDPYAGTGTGIQSLMDAFDFGSYSPGVNFLLMPVSADLLKIQAIEFNDQVRRSAYSFRISNNQLELFPIPCYGGKLRIEYYKLSDKRKLNPSVNAGDIADPGEPGVITNVSEVPYKNPTYSKINSIGRDWIFRYTLALCKEVLAYIRGKYQQLPVPGSETTLNHSDLLSDARTEKENLLKELNDTLDITSRQSQLERKANEAKSLNGVLTSVPMMVYIG